MSSEINTVCKIVKEICETEHNEEYKKAKLLIKNMEDKKKYVKDYCLTHNRNVVSFRSRINNKRYSVVFRSKVRNITQVPIDRKEEFTVASIVRIGTYEIEHETIPDEIFIE
jgi:hypothetical protein